jgi:hypothetical protein
MQLCTKRKQEERPTVTDILCLPIVSEWAKKVSISVGYRKPITMEQLDPTLLETEPNEFEELN